MELLYIHKHCKVGNQIFIFYYAVFFKKNFVDIVISPNKKI